MRKILVCRALAGGALMLMTGQAAWGQGTAAVSTQAPAQRSLAVASNAASAPSPVLKECDPWGSRCRAVRRFSSVKFCQQARVSYMAVNKASNFRCGTE